MRRAEGPCAEQAGAGRQRAGDRVDGARLERLIEGQRRQDRRHAPGEHGLAAARRANQQQVVPSGRGNLERAAGETLTAHVGEVWLVARRRGTGRGTRQPVGGRRVVQHPHGFGQGRDRPYAQPCDDSGFRRVRRRQQERRGALGARGHRDRKHAAGSLDRAVEGELPEQHHVFHGPALDHARGGEHAQSNRQVERGASLPHVGRRQVHRDAFGGKLEAAVADGRAHAIAALPHAGVGQADHREHREPERDVDFDVDRDGLDAENRGRPDAGQHRRTCVQGTRQAA